MPSSDTIATGLEAKTPKRFRLPGIVREGSAQLSLLETALWPLKGGPQHRDSFVTNYSYATPEGAKQATVRVRAPLGLEPFDELVLWGLLGAPLNRFDGGPALLATPFWMLRHLRLDTGGFRCGQFCGNRSCDWPLRATTTTPSTIPNRKHANKLLSSS
jgi:hypothetical protein